MDPIQVTPGQYNDPEALRKLIMQRMFGQSGAVPLGGAPGGSPPATPFASMTPAVPQKPAAPHVLSEAEYNQQNPAAPHTPYQAPGFKHRLLEGIFAGMQEFSRPGQGAATIRDYLSNIESNEQAEKNYPETAAAAAHQKYMNYTQGQKAPLDLEELHARIGETQASAKEKLAKARAEANPAPKTKLVQFAGEDGHPIPALQNQTTGEITDQEGKSIPGARLWAKPEAQKALKDVTVIDPKDGKPHTYGVNDKGEKVQDYGVHYEAPRETRGDKSADQVERETRVNVRKAQQEYRQAAITRQCFLISWMKRTRATRSSPKRFPSKEP